MAEDDLILLPVPRLENFDIDFRPGEFYAGIQRRSRRRKDFRRWQYWVKTFLNLIVSLIGDGFFVWVVVEYLFKNKMPLS